MRNRRRCCLKRVRKSSQTSADGDVTSLLAATVSTRTILLVTSTIDKLNHLLDCEK